MERVEQLCRHFFSPLVLQAIAFGALNSILERGNLRVIGSLAEQQQPGNRAVLLCFGIQNLSGQSDFTHICVGGCINRSCHSGIHGRIVKNHNMCLLIG